MSRASDERAARRRRGLLIVVLAIGLYLPTLAWGVPYASAEGRQLTFATDEILPLGPLAEMHNTFVTSKPDRNYAYPWFHYFAAAAAQAPYLGALWLGGGLRSPSPSYPYGLEDPVSALRDLTLIGRLLSLLMAAGVVLAAYHIGCRLFDERTGLLTALLTLTNFLMGYYSGTGNVDVPAAFWSALGLVVFAGILRHGLGAGRAVWLGLWAGLAMATKDQAVLLFLPLALALLFPRFAPAPPPPNGRRGRILLGGLLASIAAYLVGCGMLFDPARHLTHVQRLFLQPETLTAADVYWPPAERTLAGTAGLAWSYLLALADALSWPVLLAAAAGMLLAARRSPRLLVLAAPFLLLFFLLALPMGHAVRRYFLPLVPLGALFAARALVGLPYGKLLFGAILLWQLLLGVDLARAQLFDTRYAAARWIADNGRPGDRLEFFGHGQKMPPLAADRISRRIAGRSEWEGELDHGASVLAYLRSEGPEYVLLIPDWTSKPGMERSEDCVPAIHEALVDGSAGYVQVARFERDSCLPALLRPRLDSPAVCPPVRIFARADLRGRPGHAP